MTNKPDLSKIDFDWLLDTAILSHGFMPYKRDYYFHIEASWQLENYAGQYLICFSHCYDLNYRTLANKDTLLDSWDDCFIDYKKWEKAGEPSGYVWGTNWALAYPGFVDVESSLTAKEWTEKLGKEMKELSVKTEIFEINLIYRNWTIEKLNSDTGVISQVLFPFKNKEDGEEILKDAMSDESVIVEELENGKGVLIRPNEQSSFMERLKRKMFGQ